MKGLFQIFFGFALLFLLAGCEPYKYPIDEHPMVKIDSALLGNWKAKIKKDKAIVSFSVKDAYHYSVVISEAKNNDKEYYSAFISKVGDSRFLNLLELKGVNPEKGDTVNAYNYLRLINVSKKCGRMKMAFYTDSLLSDCKNSAEVRATIEKHMNESEHNSNSFTLKKKKD